MDAAKDRLERFQLFPNQVGLDEYHWAISYMETIVETGKSDYEYMMGRFIDTCKMVVH